MHRETTFFISKLDTIPTCNGPIYQMTGSSFEKPFEIQYFKKDKHNLDNCEGCRQTHEKIKKQMEEYFSIFPMCCVLHKNLLKAEWFKKEDYNNIPQTVADKVIFSHHHILNNLDQENWQEEIQNYLDYAVQSFGSFPEGYGEPLCLSKYRNYIEELLTNVKFEKEEPTHKVRREGALQIIRSYSQPVKEKNTDLSLIISTYNKWYSSFPFDFPFFNPLKEYFTHTLPILSEAPVYNPYLGLAKAKIQTQSGLVEFLINTTKNILNAIDTSQLLDDEYITNQTKYNIDLQKTHHSVSQNLLLKEYSKGEKRYIKTIKKWLENEKNFIKEILPYLKKLPAPKTNAERLPNSFLLVGAEASDEPVKNLFDMLQKNNYVSTDCKADFIKAFTEKVIKKKVTWTGYFGDLKSFIQYLKSEEKIKTIGNSHWLMAAKLFTRDKEGDFTNDEIKDTKTTANDNSILELVKKL